jgi:glycosyltransferase involved in cell wall biosynthesis
VTVVVPVYNGRRCLPSCLNALISGQGVDCEIVVVDDCSIDDTQRVAQEFEVTYLKTAERSGPAAARNLGVQHARGGVVAFVDADVVLRPESLRLIADDFRKDPELAAVFGSYDEAPAESNFVSQYKNLMHHYVHQSATEAQVSFWAGCGAIRRNIFLEVGGFDVARFPKPSIEDIELGLRLSKVGKKIRLNKNLQGTHLKKWTLSELMYTDIFSRAVPWTRLILESHTLPRNLNLDYTSRASATLIGALFLCCIGLLLQLVQPTVNLTSWSTWSAVFAMLVLALTILNWGVYKWFATRRGGWFAARAVGLHWLYYFYSGCVFVVCTADHLVRSCTRSKRGLRLVQRESKFGAG